MPEPSRLDETAIAVGQFREFMATTRVSLAEVRSAVEQTRQEMQDHRTESRDANMQTSRDIADIKRALADMAEASAKRPKWHKKSMAIGAVVSIFTVATLTMVAAGQDGDLLATLTRIMGLLL